MHALHRHEQSLSQSRGRWLKWRATGTRCSEEFVDSWPRAAVQRGPYRGALAVLATGCATAPPTRQGNICEVFEQYPEWYDYARQSAARWGTPIHMQMSFVRHESSYRGDAKLRRGISAGCRKKRCYARN